MERFTKDVLEFWFGKNHEATPLQNQRNWFEKSPAFDALVTEEFKRYLTLSELEKLETLKKNAHDYLAFVLLTDQFPRHVFRGQSQSFAFDSIALRAAKSGVEQGLDKKLTWIDRIFFYMPYEHSENLEDQEKCIVLHQGLVSATPKQHVDYADEALDYAVKHWEIIKRFGRFPHRNAVLNRTSTKEEVEFLKQPGSSF